MTKYEKIYVPRDEKLHGWSADDNYYVSHSGFVGPTGKPIEVIPQRDVVVLTEDELREVWEAGYQRGGTALSRIKNQGPKPPSFTDFLQQKGVTL